jgi:hypothetical protein
MDVSFDGNVVMSDVYLFSLTHLVTNHSFICVKMTSGMKSSARRVEQLRFVCTKRT